jgi:hypothetical protein
VDQGQWIRSSTLGGPDAKIEDAMRGRPAFPAWLGRLRYYGLALLLVGSAALLRWALPDVLSPARVLMFGLAWIGAAALGGLGPGLLATVASWLCTELLFDSTPGHRGFDDPTFIPRLLAYLAGGLVLSVAGEKLRRARIHGRRHTQELAAANAALRESEFHLAQAQQITHLGSWSWISRRAACSGPTKPTGCTDCNRGNRCLGTRISWASSIPKTGREWSRACGKRSRAEDPTGSTSASSRGEAKNDTFIVKRGPSWTRRDIR